MIKFLRLALRRLAAIAVRAWPSRRRRVKESVATAPPVPISLETVEEKPVEPSGKAEITAAQAEVSQQPNPVVVPEVASDYTAPTSSELPPVLPDSGDKTSSQLAEISHGNLEADAPAAAASSVRQAEPPIPPETLVSAEPNTNVAETATARVEDVSKTAAPSVTLPNADSSSGISGDNANAATISPPESAETPSVKEEQPSVETPQQTTASKTGETHGQKRESKRIAAEHRGGARVTSGELDALPEQRERKRFEHRLRLVCFKDNYRMWRLVVELPENVGGTSDVRVTRNSKELPQADFAGNRWLLDNASGMVEAVWLADGIQERGAMELRDDGFLLFKLLHEGQAEEGRLVRAPSNGEYFVAVRQGWEISESRGIEVRGEPNFAVDGLVAFRFSVHEDTAHQSARRSNTRPRTS
jgi:hypothetical protein